MKVEWKHADDTRQLTQLIARETNAKQRDRYRVVLLAGQGLGDQSELEREEIAAITQRSRQFVDEWIGRYRRGGITLLTPKKQKGAKSRLTADECEKLCAMLDAGPSPEEGIAAYSGLLIQNLITQKFQKLYSLSGVYALLHRLGYNDLMPRTTHPDTKPEAMEAFKKTSSPLS